MPPQLSTTVPPQLSTTVDARQNSTQHLLSAAASLGRIHVESNEAYWRRWQQVEDDFQSNKIDSKLDAIFRLKVRQYSLYIALVYAYFGILLYVYFISGENIQNQWCA